MSRRFLSLLVIFVILGCQSTRPAAGPRMTPPMLGNQAPASPPKPEQAWQPPVKPTGPQAAANPSRRDDAASRELVIRATAPSATDTLERPAPTSTAPLTQKDTDKESALADIPPLPPQPGDKQPASTSKGTGESRSGLSRVKELHEQAAAKFGTISDYAARLRRREVINGKPQADDVVEFRSRGQPFSVHMKWVGGPLEGREIVYVQGKYQNQMQILTGKGDPIAGFRTSLDPHSPRATANSRRTIDEAGIGTMIAALGRALAAAESGSTSVALEYLGAQNRPESAAPMECVGQWVPPGAEKHLPRGGTRYFFFSNDPQARDYQLPVLITTYDEKRQEVEYYWFERVSTNLGQTEADFDPNALWARR